MDETTAALAAQFPFQLDDFQARGCGGEGVCKSSWF